MVQDKTIGSSPCYQDLLVLMKRVDFLRGVNAIYHQRRVFKNDMDGIDDDEQQMRNAARRRRRYDDD